MKRITLILLAVFVVTACKEKVNLDNVDSNLPKPNEFNDKFSYMVGVQMGLRMKADTLIPNVTYLVAGLKHGIAGDTSKQLMTNLEIDRVFNELQKKLNAKKDNRSAQDSMQFVQKGEQNKIEGPKFLEQNQKKPGVKVSASGLQYEILKQGSGRPPMPGDSIIVHIKGSFIDGKEFDNTYTRGPVPTPVTLKIDPANMVPGWIEAFSLMKPGAKWRLVMPPHLGWGEKGAPPTIPGNTLTIFEIELLSIKGNPNRPSMP
ncbi:MAG: peptidylprolyl cis-trans isomerase, FKBP-type [Ignavibacteria bacterium]|nr:peptidylprolyl cis-trans isomerase, FKBP-type [Ignavibacteria bacterium]